MDHATVFHANRAHAGAVLLDSGRRTVDPRHDRLDARFLQHRVELRHRDVRLERERDVAPLLLAAAGELRALFAGPVRVLVVVLANAAVEVTRKPTDRRVAADIRGAKA